MIWSAMVTVVSSLFSVMYVLLSIYNFISIATFILYMAYSNPAAS